MKFWVFLIITESYNFKFVNEKILCAFSWPWGAWCAVNTQGEGRTPLTHSWGSRGNVKSLSVSSPETKFPFNYIPQNTLVFANQMISLALIYILKKCGLWFKCMHFSSLKIWKNSNSKTRCCLDGKAVWDTFSLAWMGSLG